MLKVHRTMFSMYFKKKTVHNVKLDYILTQTSKSVYPVNQAVLCARIMMSAPPANLTIISIQLLPNVFTVVKCFYIVQTVE